MKQLHLLVKSSGSDGLGLQKDGDDSQRYTEKLLDLQLQKENNIANF